MQVQFKFDESAPASVRERVVEELEREGAANVEPLFPGETDTSLSTVYMADYPSVDDGQAVVTAIGDRDVVEYAELAPERRLL